MVILKLEKTMKEFCNTLYLSQIDLKEIYHTILWGEESRLLTTFLNRQNVFQCKCLIHETISVFGSCQKGIKLAITGCPNLVQNV